MAITDGNRMALYVWLDVQCRRDPTHILGTAVMHLAPHPRAGRIVVSNGLAFDEHNVAHGDCTRCPGGKGRNQQVSLNSIQGRVTELLGSNRYNGKLQA